MSEHSLKRMVQEVRQSSSTVVIFHFQREYSMTKDCDVSIIIPCFNEEESLPELLGQLQKAFPEGGEYCVEFLCIDDGSTDGSLAVLETLQQSEKRLHLVSFRRNFGKTIALTVGFKLACGKNIVTIDADLQNDPHDIRPMLEKLSEKVDMVCGWRRNRHDPLDKTLPSRVINAIIKTTTALRIHDINCGLKVMKRDVIETLQLYSKQHRYIPLKAHFAGFAIEEHEINHRSRKYGHSKYGFWRFPEGIFDLLSILFIGIFDRSPLYLFGGLGLFSFFIGAVMLIYLTVGWFFDQWIGNRPLFSFSILFLIFGFQLISIGLLGELILNVSKKEFLPPYKEINRKSVCSVCETERDEESSR